MPIRIDEIIETILPEYDVTTERNSFYKTGQNIYSENFANTEGGSIIRKGLKNQGDFLNKKLFITNFADYNESTIRKYLIFEELIFDKIEKKEDYTAQKICGKDGTLEFINITEKEYLTKEIIEKIIESNRLPDLLSSAIEKNKLTELLNDLNDLNDDHPNNTDLIQKINNILEKINNNYKQLIIYGPAGVGKTFGIKKLVSENFDNNGLSISKTNFEEHVIHTVFHPEYSYYDFFGKVMPIKNDNEISYDFLPGPFAQALSKAYKNIINQKQGPKKVVLVIDELNRGNASSIFGGLFNLLDRNKKGISEYPLNIYGMEAMWLKNQIGGDDNFNILEMYSKKQDFMMYDEDNQSLKIYIPNNLSIICTMNTSDQTIFSLDKAFQRRFNKHFITAKYSIDNYPIKNGEDDIEIEKNGEDDIEIDEQGITWKNFLIKLNNFIVENADVDDVDNATIGAYFVKPKNKDGREVILIEDIKYTIMYYLWYDLFNGWKRETLIKELGNNFGEVKSFEQFVSKYQNFINFFIQTQTDTTN